VNNTGIDKKQKTGDILKEDEQKKKVFEVRGKRSWIVVNVADMSASL